VFTVFMVLFFLFYKILFRLLFTSYDNLKFISDRTESPSRVWGRRALILGVAVIGLLAVAFLIQWGIALSPLIPAYHWLQQSLYTMRSAWWLHVLISPIIGDGFAHVGAPVAGVAILSLAYYLNYILVVLVVTRLLRDTIRQIEKEFPFLRENRLYEAF